MKELFKSGRKKVE